MKTATKQKYPTWKRINETMCVSEEQIEGASDFVIYKEGKTWSLKWRTSAKWITGFPTLRAAKDSVSIEILK